MHSTTTSKTLIDLSRLRWAKLCPSLRVLIPADNTCVYRQGERCDDFYVIARGYIKLSRVSAAGMAHTIVILPAGDVCGAPLTGEPTPRAPDAATAKGEVALYRMPLRDLMSALSVDAELAGFIIPASRETAGFPGASHRTIAE